MSKILFICTSNKDRSPALEKYFGEKYPKHEYRSAGINKYFCEKKETHYLTQEDINWAEVVIYCEDIHYKTAQKNFHSLPDPVYPGLKQGLILNCGDYRQGQVDADYLTKAEYKMMIFL